MRAYIKQFISLILCTLFVVGIALGNPGSVLCVGEDGHVEIESVSNSCCSFHGETFSVDESGSGSVQDDDCVNCTHVSLYQELLSHRLRNGFCCHRTVHPESISPLTMYIPVLCPMTDNGTRTVLKDFELPSFTGSVSTTILLC